MGGKGTSSGTQASNWTTNQTQNYQANPQVASVANEALQSAQNAVQLFPYSANLVQQIAPLTDYQNQAGQEIAGAQGMAQPYYQQGKAYMDAAGSPITSQDINQYYNPMASSVTDQLKNIFGQQNQQNNSSLINSAGGVGADRIAVGQGQLANQQGLAAGQTYAGLYQNALTAAQQQKQQQLATGYGVGQLGTAAQGSQLQGAQALNQAGQQQQAVQQALNNAGYQWQQGAFANQFQMPQYLASIAGGLAPALGGTTTGFGSGTQNSMSTATPAQVPVANQAIGLGTSLAGAVGGKGSGGRVGYAAGGRTRPVFPGPRDLQMINDFQSFPRKFYSGGPVKFADGGGLGMESMMEDGLGGADDNMALGMPQPAGGAQSGAMPPMPGLNGAGGGDPAIGTPPGASPSPRIGIPQSAPPPMGGGEFHNNLNLSPPPPPSGGGGGGSSGGGKGGGGGKGAMSGLMGMMAKGSGGRVGLKRGGGVYPRGYDEGGDVDFSDMGGGGDFGGDPFSVEPSFGGDPSGGVDNSLMAGTGDMAPASGWGEAPGWDKSAQPWPASGADKGLPAPAPADGTPGDVAPPPAATPTIPNGAQAAGAKGDREPLQLPQVTIQGQRPEAPVIPSPNAGASNNLPGQAPIPGPIARPQQNIPMPPPPQVAPPPQAMPPGVMSPGMAPALGPLQPVANAAQAVGQGVGRAMSGLGGMIQRMASGAGLDPNAVGRFMQIESGGNPNATTGSYHGLFQLSHNEFANNGGQGSIFDPVQNARAGINSLANKSANFTQQNGRPPSATELYLMHQQGEGGLAAHMANPDGLAWQNMASTAEGRQKGAGWAKQAIWGNLPASAKAQFGNVNNITSRDFINTWDARVNRGGPPSGGMQTAQAGNDTSSPGSGLTPDNVKQTAGLPATVNDRFNAVTPQSRPGNIDMNGQRLRGVPQVTPATTPGEPSRDMVTGEPRYNSDMQMSDYQQPRGQQPYPNRQAESQDAGQNLAHSSSRMALIRAGASIASNTGGIGTALAGGINAGATELATQRKALQTEEGINQRAQGLFQQAKQHLNQYQRVPASTQALIGARSQQGNYTVAGQTPDGQTMLMNRKDGTLQAAPQGFTPAAKSTAVQSNANWLMQQGIAKNPQEAFNMAHSGVNDGATWQRLVQAEKKLITQTPEGAGMSADKLEQQAQQNVVQRRQSMPGANGQQPITTPPAPPSDTGGGGGGKSGGTPVGKEVTFSSGRKFKKVKDGPDTDKSNWQLVQ